MLTEVPAGRESLWRRLLESTSVGNNMRLNPNDPTDPLVYGLEIALSALAEKFRYHNKKGDTDEATRFVSAYLEVATFLWERGWRGEFLPLDSMLPAHVAPPHLRFIDSV